MASDPYHNFAAELRASIASAQSQAASYSQLVASSSSSRPWNGRGVEDVEAQRGSSSSSSSSSSHTKVAQRGNGRPPPPPPNQTSSRESLQARHDALADALESLRADVDDLEESVRVVAQSPERFGVDHAELEARRAFVRSCEAQVAELERIAGRRPSMGIVPKGGGAASDAKASWRGDDGGGAGQRGDEEDEDPNEAFEREQQESLLAKQDDTLSLIGTTITSLRRQASTLGHEIGEQVELLTQLDAEVDQSSSRLAKAWGRMDELARRSDDRLGGWCVWILVVVLFLLLLMVILI